MIQDSRQLIGVPGAGRLGHFICSLQNDAVPGRSGISRSGAGWNLVR